MSRDYFSNCRHPAVLSILLRCIKKSPQNGFFMPFYFWQVLHIKVSRVFEYTGFSMRCLTGRGFVLLFCKAAFVLRFIDEQTDRGIR